MSQMYWHNYKTGEAEYIDTPEDFTNYIPQVPAAQKLYKLYVEHMNLLPINAACKVLEVCIGKKAVEQSVQLTDGGHAESDSESNPPVSRG